MHLGKTFKKRVTSCPESSLTQGSSNISHGASGFSKVTEKWSFESNVNTNVENKKQFRTRFVYACNQKIDALMAMPKQIAVEVGLRALKGPLPAQIQTKKRVPCGSKVRFCQDHEKSYAEVVKASTNNHDTGCKPRDCTSNSLDYDQTSLNAITTVAGMSLNKKAPQVVHNDLVCHVAGQKDFDIEQGYSESSDSHESKIFDINGLDDKYLHSILNVTPDRKSWKQIDNEITRAWRSQTEFEFGFIPLSQFQEATSDVVNELADYCPIKAHNIVLKSGKPNFLQARVKVDTQLHLDEWQKQLQGYWDTQLLDLLRFGFPLDFNRLSPLQWEGKNHKSAIEYPRDIDAYIAEEMSFNAIVGPFKDHPCPNGHISPFMSRDKPDSKNRRVIIDLSWPQGQSVNSGIDKTTYLGTDFNLVLPTVDHITDRLRSLGRGAHIYKIDISRAFRHIKVDPLDYNLLGLHWHHVYVDTCVPFGSRHGSQIFQRVSDAVRFMMRRAGHGVINYVDDYVGFGVPSDAKCSYDHLYDLLDRLGLTISQKKLVPPSTSAVCLGVKIDTEKGTISIPESKMRQICDTVSEWKNKKYCTKRQLQSLLGHLLYIHKCVRPARYFLNRMLHILREYHGQNRIHLNPEFHRDLRWFERFLPLYNGVSLYDHEKPDHQVHLDACLQGLGGVWTNMVYHIPIPLGFKGLNIVHLEMVNILVAVKLFCTHWKGKNILIHCDNFAVVNVLRSGRARDAYLAACARNIWLWAAIHDIQFTYTHVSGKSNRTADLLSRWTNSPSNSAELSVLVPSPNWVLAGLQALEIDAEI